MLIKNRPQLWRSTRHRPISAGNPVILVALLIGLLNFPAMSTSGAELSHAHSLFMLGHHHHDLDGTIDFTSEHHGDASTDAAPPAATSTPSGLLLQEPADEFVGGAPIGLTISGPFSSNLVLTSVSPYFLLEPIPTGETEEPETPPPRV